MDQHHFAVLREAVTSPGGTTAQALYQLEKGGIRTVIADAVEAMASDRPYRRDLSFEKIKKELKRNSSTQFDPLIIETILQILQERNEYILVNSAEKLTVEQCEYAFVNP